VISKGLPKTRLKDALDAFNACTELGLDLQLKVLQALPSLLQNYSNDLQDGLLASALQVCASLQSAKVQTVSGVATATLQQLVTAVFEKVVDEDRRSSSVPATAEVPGDGGPIRLRPAAFDAYRMFRDLVLVAEERPTKFVQLAALSRESSLELIFPCLQANSKLFANHQELSSVIRSNLLPLLTRSLSEKLPFPMTVRCLRVLNCILGRQFAQFPEECEVALGLLTQNLDLDAAAPWKRALCLELVRNFFASGSTVIEAYARFDQAEGGKPVIQDLLATFVRLSAEKPALIGLGQQSSIPLGNHSPRESGGDQAAGENAGGVASVISSALGVSEASAAGISSQWSQPRAPCLDLLDKGDTPVFHETYIYALVLECLNNLSDTLAKAVLPLTVRNEVSVSSDGPQQTNGHESTHLAVPGRSRSQSFQKRSVPLNPLEVEDNPPVGRARTVASMVDTCWPAVLATCSTFLNAALEDQYYKNLIKAYQRFAQVAGLLRLTTPRDALMTTLSKSAVPPHILNAAMTEGAKSPSTPSTESPRVFSNSKNLLSVESFVSQASSLSSDRDRRSSIEPARPMLTTRNLLCLRALLNLAIALGPTLDTAFNVVVDALKQADMVLSSDTSQQAMKKASFASQKAPDTASAVQAFSVEVAAVEAAASRLLESTAEYPNDAFLAVLRAFTRLLSGRTLEPPISPKMSSPPSTPVLKERTFSGLPGISTIAEMQARDYQFVIPKLGNLAQLNVARFTSNEPTESGWTYMVDELARIASTGSKPRDARRSSTDVLCRLAAETISDVVEDDASSRAVVQRRGLAILLQLVDGIYAEDGELSTTDLEIQEHVVDALKAILERSGDSIVSGWNKTVAILSSSFERTESTAMTQQHDTETRIQWAHISSDLVSIPVGRAAFAATQLICSDFLASLPLAVMPSLTELLYRFVSQADDLNIALTTVTMAWNVADHLFGSISTDQLEGFVEEANDEDDLPTAIEKRADTSKPAQLFLMLFRMREAVARTRKEVRNAVFQTICSIYKNHGQQLTKATWELMLRNIVIRFATDDAMAHLAEAESENQPDGSQSHVDEEMSKVIIAGVADITAQHLSTIEQIKKLPSLWEVLLSTMEAYLDCERHVLNAAVYNALAKVLSQVESGSTTWTTPAYRTVALWLKKLPEQADGTTSKDGNQEAYFAYIDTASQLYRLTRETISSPQTRKFVDNVFYCVQHSDGPKYNADVQNMSPLQAKALNILRNVRVDMVNLPSRLIGAAAQLSRLHHETRAANQQGPTFVAIGSEAIVWLRTMILAHISDPEVAETGALLSGVRSLRQLIAEKYNYLTEHKGRPLWRQATLASLELARPVLDLAEHKKTETSTRFSLWAEYVAIAAAIVKANGLETVSDRKKIYEDVLADREAFKTLQPVLIPRLGSPDLPVDIRQAYCRALFDASIVHETKAGEIPDASSSPLSNLLKIRRGRVICPPYSQREKMCYVCFNELIALASKSSSSPEREALAQAAAPLLILRLAIPIRAYIADQPLRGRRPQPLSELEELLFCFEEIKKLELHPRALAADPVADGRTGEKAHLRFLYPLLAKAVATAGDGWSGAAEVLEPLQKVLECIQPA
jgi:hypothetical protein